MEFVQGEKISDAFAGDGRRRAKLARRLSDALTFDVIFSAHQEALFTVILMLEMCSMCRMILMTLIELHS